jgi:hypothetical protein
VGTLYSKAFTIETIVKWRKTAFVQQVKKPLVKQQAITAASRAITKKHQTEL